MRRKRRSRRRTHSLTTQGLPEHAHTAVCHMVPKHETYIHGTCTCIHKGLLCMYMYVCMCTNMHMTVNHYMYVCLEQCPNKNYMTELGGSL